MENSVRQPTKRSEDAVPLRNATLRTVERIGSDRAMSVSDWKNHSHNVYQASGIVCVQAECTLDDALAMIKDRAEVSHQSVEAIAVAVIERRIQFGT